MRKILLALALLVCGNIMAQDAGQPFISVQARGFVMDDDADTVYYEHVFDDKNGGPSFVVGAIQKAGRRQTTMLFKPETAEKIAHEVQPYVTLFERGRKFSEEIKINPTVSIAVTSKNGMQLTIRNANEKSVLQYRGEKLFQLVKGWTDAVELSRTWLAARLGAAVPGEGRSGDDAAWTQGSIEGSDPVLGLEEVAADYGANEYAADAKYRQYLNQSVVAVGTVKTVSRDSRTEKPKILFTQSIGSTPITCLLDDASDEEVATLQPGKSITVDARWMGKTEGAEPNLVQGRIMH